MHRFRYDLHLHTEYSPDCDTRLSTIEDHCLNRGITGIAVTDHNQIDGALRLRDSVRELKVIVGEEISSRDGDIVGLYLSKRIGSGMSAADTVDAIHSQGGCVYLPHPFDRARARRSKGASLATIIDRVDIVEIFNGKVGSPRYNQMALEYARRLQKLGAGGSDAHSLRAIGTVYNEFMAEEPPGDAASLLKCLAESQLTGRRRSPVGGWFIVGRRPISLAWRKITGS